MSDDIVDWLTTSPDQAEIEANLASVDVYITTTPPRTTFATKLQDDWKVWYNGLTWYKKHVEPGYKNLYNEARNRRNEFSKANSITEAEKQATADVIHSGMTTEQQAGGTRQISSKGEFHVDKPPIVPDWLWWSAAAGGVLVVIASAYGFGIAAPAALLARVTAAPRHREA